MTATWNFLYNCSPIFLDNKNDLWKFNDSHDLNSFSAGCEAEENFIVQQKNVWNWKENR